MQRPKGMLFLTSLQLLLNNDYLPGRSIITLSFFASRYHYFFIFQSHIEQYFNIKNIGRCFFLVLIYSFMLTCFDKQLFPYNAVFPLHELEASSRHASMILVYLVEIRNQGQWIRTCLCFGIASDDK